MFGEIFSKFEDPNWMKKIEDVVEIFSKFEDIIKVEWRRKEDKKHMWMLEDYISIF